jgi:hypothetical protein
VFAQVVGKSEGKAKVILGVAGIVGEAGEDVIQFERTDAEALREATGCGAGRSGADHRQQHFESTEGLQRVRLMCRHENRFACRRP